MPILTCRMIKHNCAGRMQCATNLSDKSVTGRRTPLSPGKVKTPPRTAGLFWASATMIILNKRIRSRRSVDTRRFEITAPRWGGHMNAFIFPRAYSFRFKERIHANGEIEIYKETLVQIFQKISLNSRKLAVMSYGSNSKITFRLF